MRKLDDQVEMEALKEVCAEAEQQIARMVNRVFAGRRQVAIIDLEATGDAPSKAKKVS